MRTEKERDQAREDTTGEGNTSRTAMDKQAGSAHTPGPWEIEDLCDCASPHLAIRPKGQGYLLAQLSAQTWTYGASEKHDIWANARLIAAAPDLLAALKEYAEKLRDDGCDITCGVASHERVFAAIAKAEGKV